VVILDEADAMTAGAQQALRRTMELHSSTTRFALACNTSAKVIEPIQSRCAVLRFGRLSDAEVLARLQTVAAAERVATTPDGLEALIFSADGDMRQALNNLQSTAAGFGLVDREAVLKVCDQPHPLVLGAALRACAAGDLDEAARLVGGLWDAGYAASDIIGTFFRVVRNAKPDLLPEWVQLEFIRAVGGAHARAVEGVGSRLQCMAMLARMAATAEESIAKGLLKKAPPAAQQQRGVAVA
jgi:replication factor C subunit 2/4